MKGSSNRLLSELRVQLCWGLGLFLGLAAIFGSFVVLNNGRRSQRPSGLNINQMKVISFAFNLVIADAEAGGHDGTQTSNQWSLRLSSFLGPWQPVAVTGNPFLISQDLPTQPTAQTNFLIHQQAHTHTHTQNEGERYKLYFVRVLWRHPFEQSAPIRIKGVPNCVQLISWNAHTMGSWPSSLQSEQWQPMARKRSCNRP